MIYLVWLKSAPLASHLLNLMMIFPIIVFTFFESAIVINFIMNFTEHSVCGNVF